MDFLDKIGNIAKNIGDRTNDAIEITKLNAKISSEKNAAAEELNKIGDFYYKKFAGEEPIDTEIQDFCAAAAAHYEAIEQAKAEIERIKRENNPKGNSADNDEAGRRRKTEIIPATLLPPNRKRNLIRPRNLWWSVPPARP